jgi:hypothetical protein
MKEELVTDLPVFATALRGYDRQQVDDYVATLLSYLDEAARRLERAERPGRDPDARVATGTPPTTAQLDELERSVRERLSAAERALESARTELEALATERVRLVDELLPSARSGPA